MRESSAPHPSYRPEIDGLRAIAVLGVVLFHAKLGLGGGFVGVDVFFVISGFLITGIIAKGLASGTFTLKDFFTRRIKRILPASATMVAVVAFAGAMLLLPSDLERLMRSALWNALMLANFHFSDKTGYFAEAAELQPLLHMGSLAVEEQFYLIFPGVMLLVHNFARRHMFAIVCLLGCASFGFSVWQTEWYPTQAFYLLPSRAWELLAGAALALAPTMRLSKVAGNALAMIGAGAIAYALMMFDTSTPFPGAWALVPVGGTVAMIAGMSHPGSLVYKLLASKPLVAVGKLSYSIYLWHWPPLVFANLLMPEVSPALSVALALSSVALAIPSYYLIEQPFRRGFLIPTPQRAFRFAVATSVVIMCASGLTDLMEGFPGRYPSTLRPYVEDVAWTGGEYATDEGDPPISIGRARDGGPPDFILWGDSHAQMLAICFDEVAHELGLSGDVYAVSGKPPVPGVWGYDHTSDEIETALEQRKITERRILESGTRSVILVSRWSSFCVGHSEVEVASGMSREGPILVDNPAMSPPPPEVAADTLRRHLATLVERFESRGINVWLMQQCPECESVYAARDFLKWKLHPSLYSDHNLEDALITIDEHRQRQQHSRQVFESLAETGARVVDPTANFFDERGVLRLCGERCYYRDNDHLTQAGVRDLCRPTIVDLLSQTKALAARGESSDAVRQATREAPQPEPDNLQR